LPPSLDRIPHILGVAEASEFPFCAPDAAAEVDLQVRVAGFGGQGVLVLGEVLAEAGLHAGFEVSWLPSYGPEMRSGTSNCHVRVSHLPIDSPLVTSPNVLIAMNEPSLKKFAAGVQPGGWILYNGDAIPTDCLREDVHALACPFTQIGDELGEVRAANMIMLGMLVEISGALPEASITAGLERVVKNSRWLAIDTRALARGRELYRELHRE
jgi:Pyruvate/2-oxoacid:ferredoxin oxidoreductase gamma subunit